MIATPASLLRKLALGAAMLVSGCGGGDDGADNFASVSDAIGTYYSWMSAEIKLAWENGFYGQLARVAVVDQFQNVQTFEGNLGPGPQVQSHGDWVKQQVINLAPRATVDGIEVTLNERVPLSQGLNILNLSYGAYGRSGLTVRWDKQESSIIEYAKNGAAVVVNAAGNDFGTAIGQASQTGDVDYMSLDLIGAQSAIFVGALSSNGSIGSPASMEAYSNIAGSNTVVQNQFLVVGVEGSKTGLYGTSFAAPVVSGYAAVLGSKFTSATPTQIANQLLRTARKDTVKNYDVTIHGQGEASIANALAPQSIN